MSEIIRFTTYQEALLSDCEEFVKAELADGEKGHDWWHIYRVRKNALLIASHEPVDHFIVALGALLHDIADAKFHDGDEEAGARKAEAFLQLKGADEDIVNHVKGIINNISFKGGRSEKTFSSPELLVVQDADRLDAIGAIGIARTFHYGGYKGRLLYHPDIPPVEAYATAEAYRKSESPTINHFYEKLLLLKDKMNTQTGRELAERRHAFLEQYLDQFFSEWNGIC